MNSGELAHLYPSMAIVAECLERAGTVCRVLGKPDSRRLRGVRLFARGASMNAEMLYVVRPKDTAAFPGGFVCAATVPVDGGAAQLMCPDLSPEVLLEQLLELFSRYQAMEDSMDALVYRVEGLQALCELGAELMGNPLCLHDDWFVLVAKSSEFSEVMPPDYIMSSSREFLPRIVVEDFRNDTEYLETYASREARIWDIEPRCLYVNLWEGSVYRGRLLAAEYHRPFSAEDFMVAEVLAQRALLLLGRNRPGEERAFRSMDDIMYDLLNQRRTEAQEEARLLNMLGWNRGDRLVCVRLADQQMDASVLHAHALHSDLFVAFPDSYVMFAEHQQCVVLNLTRHDETLSMLRHRLAPLCRDYCLYAGISSPVRETGELYLAWRQARAALDRVFQLRSDRWILAFSECALNYILEKAQAEMALRSLVAPELQRLIEYDQEKGTPYFETLRAWLLHERDIPRTAEALIIHRTTLLYRLKKLQTIAPMDLDDPARRLYLLLSLRILDSTGGEE